MPRARAQRHGVGDIAQGVRAVQEPQGIRPAQGTVQVDAVRERSTRAVPAGDAAGEPGAGGIGAFREGPEPGPGARGEGACRGVEEARVRVGEGHRAEQDAGSPLGFGKRLHDPGGRLQQLVEPASRVDRADPRHREVPVVGRGLDREHARSRKGRQAQPQAQDRLVMARVRADQQDRLLGLEFVDGPACIRGARVLFRRAEVAHAQPVLDGARSRPAQQAREQGALLDGARRLDQADLVGGLAEGLADAVEGHVPAEYLPAPVAVLHRFGDPVRVLAGLVAEPVAIGQPGLVDLGGLARHGAHDPAAPAVVVQLRADAVVLARAPVARHLPGARVHARGPGIEGADRAQVDDAAGQLRVQGLLHVGADLHELAPAEGAEFHVAGDLLREAHAARAVDAAGHVGRHQRSQVRVRYDPPRFGGARLGMAVLERRVLQLALPSLVADRAVERVVEQQELHGGALRIARGLGEGVDLHALCHGRGAGRGRAAGPRHLDQAHAAVGRHGQPRVVAETRDMHADAVGDRDQHLPGVGLDLAPVDLDAHGRSAHCGGPPWRT